MCWLPFFLLYTISPLCPICEGSLETKLGEDSSGALGPWTADPGQGQRCCIHSWGFSFAFWLGYSNSALNPVKLGIIKNVFFIYFHLSIVQLNG